MTENILIEEMLKKFELGILEEDENKLKDLNDKSIFLYGYGKTGKRIFRILDDNGIKIVGFIDRNYKLLVDRKRCTPVYAPDSEELKKYKETSYVILTGLFFDKECSKIKNDLKQIGFNNILSLSEVNFSLFTRKAFYQNNFDGSLRKIDVIGQDKDKIINAFSLLETDKDKQIYIEFVKAHLTMDFTRFSEPISSEYQYLAHDIKVEKDYTNLIDCGGFNGDTIRNFIEHDKQISNLAVFEPQNILCEKIYDFTKENNDKFNSVTIFPCGVGMKFDKFSFSNSGDSLSSYRITENGTEMIQCAPIDKVLQGFKPTFIKMDIEGAELVALKGAKDTIVNSIPQLAICVYHSLSDIWEIPLLIKEAYSKYKFYLRSYNYLGLETVLYAFPEK